MKKLSGWSNESRHARGYGAAWDRLRLVILARDHGLCQCPECQGGSKQLKQASEVHHIVGKTEAKARGWTDAQIDDESNLQAINNECHKRITAAEQGRTLKQKMIISADGWAIPAKG